jgi:hypothetical protein
VSVYVFRCDNTLAATLFASLLNLSSCMISAAVDATIAEVRSLGFLLWVNALAATRLALLLEFGLSKILDATLAIGECVPIFIAYSSSKNEF